MVDDAAFAELVATRGHALLRTACFLAGSQPDGEDLLQQSLVNVYASFRRIRDARALEGYVRTTMVRAASSADRKSWRRWERSTDALPETSLPVYESSLGDGGEVWPLLVRLSPRQRAVMVLRYYEDRSEAEIADLLGCSTGTVKRHAARGLERLRGLLGEQAIATQAGDIS